MNKLPYINCPICGGTCKVRIKTGDHINKQTKILKKQPYYQYYCKKCDDAETGSGCKWTAVEIIGKKAAALL